ncbi:MAG: DUF2007 domain-containing protein [Rhizobacter sp.]
MKTLYEAASAVEAHMLQDLLKQEGIEATVHGAYLQGAIGELPASGLVRLLVEDERYEAGRAAIARWESTQVTDPTPRPARRKSNAFAGGVVGLLIGVTASSAFFRAPVSVEGVDHNRDGVIDERWTYSPSGALVKMEVDRNLDGKIDYIAHYDLRGQIDSAESDDDFNGVFETHQRFYQGNIEYSETDSDGDGFPDLRYYFSHGVLQSTEYVSAVSGHVVRAERYRLGRLVEADADTDNDGVLDMRYSYSAFGAITSTAPIALAPK